jgi:hypothetical protein
MHILAFVIVLLVGSGLAVVVDNAIGMKYESTAQQFAHKTTYIVFGGILAIAMAH